MPRVSDRVSPCLLDTANIDLLKILQRGDSKYRHQSISDLTCFDAVRSHSLVELYTLPAKSFANLKWRYQIIDYHTISFIPFHSQII
jgi:hypothetical protein